MRTSAYIRENASQNALRVIALAITWTLASSLIRAQTPGDPPTFPHALRPAGAMQNGPRTQPPAPSTLPPTPPTTAAAQTTPAANTLPGPIAATPLNAAGTTSSRPHRAEVAYSAGQLTIRANDSSLDQILSAICKETGLTITGGVADQRVFGVYGPASTSAILSTLLDGTGTNILLREGSATTPPELVLTPRDGGPTPPSPSAIADDSIVDTPPQPAPAAPSAPVKAETVTAPATSDPARPTLQVGPIPPNNVLGSQYNTTPTASEIPTAQSVPLDSLPQPTTTPSPSGIVDSPNPPSGATPAPSAPAAPGALTPEAVYQQLLQMQKKQAQQPAAPASTTTPPQ